MLSTFYLFSKQSCGVCTPTCDGTTHNLSLGVFKNTLVGRRASSLWLLVLRVCLSFVKASHGHTDTTPLFFVHGLSHVCDGVSVAIGVQLSDLSQRKQDITSIVGGLVELNPLPLTCLVK